MYIKAATSLIFGHMNCEVVSGAEEQVACGAAAPFIPSLSLSLAPLCPSQFLYVLIDSQPYHFQSIKHYTAL